MTSNSGPKKRRSPFNFLNKQGTARTRQDYIEADYIDGVHDANGRELIRPMTKEEVEWLSQFYAETEHENFKKTDEIETQTKLYKSLCKDYRKHRKSLPTEKLLQMKQEIETQYKRLVQLRAETNTFYPEDSQRHEIYDKGNARRNDIFNVAKASNRLIAYGSQEFDKFTSEAEKDISPENLALNYLVKKPAKKVTRRRKKN
jgi:hypothetical protein